MLAVPSDERDHFDRESPIIYEETLKYISEGLGDALHHLAPTLRHHDAIFRYCGYYLVPEHVSRR